MGKRKDEIVITAHLDWFEPEEYGMHDDLIETMRDCANALGELLPRDHAYRKNLWAGAD